MTDDEFKRRYANLLTPDGLTPNQLRIALFKFINNVDETPWNRVIWREVSYLLLEGDFLPDLHERMKAAWANVQALSRPH